MFGTRDTWLQLWFLHKKIITSDGEKKKRRWKWHTSRCKRFFPLLRLFSMRFQKTMSMCAFISILNVFHRQNPQFACKYTWKQAHTHTHTWMQTIEWRICIQRWIFFVHCNIWTILQFMMLQFFLLKPVLPLGSFEVIISSRISCQIKRSNIRFSFVHVFSINSNIHN